MRRLSPSPLLILLLLWASPVFAAAPTAVSASATTSEDLPSVFALRASDPDRDALTYEVVTAPTHGTVYISGRNAQYIPTANYSGTDNYTFRVRDTGGLYSNVATMSYTITAANDPPTAAAGALTVTEDGSGALTLGGADVDGNTLTYSIATNPANGVVSIHGSTGLAVFTPNSNWSGTTTFRYQVSDGLVSAAATVTVTVLSVNDVPVANAAAATLNEDAGSIFSIIASDGDNDALTYSIVSAPTHGTATLDGRMISYTPAPNYHGPDSLSFVASDASSTSAAATATLTVTPVNDVPTVAGAIVLTDEDVPVSIALSGADVDGDTLTWVLDSTSNGTATVDATTGLTTFTPAPDLSGGGQFSFHVNDGTVSSLSAAVTVAIAAIDDTPVATDLTVSLAEDSAETTITLIGTDPDSASLTYTITSLPTHGSLITLGRSARYTPAPDYSGPDTFTYTVSDGVHTSSPGTVSITLTGVNDPPTARNTAAMSDGAPISIWPMATDVESTVSAPILGTLPTHGTVAFETDHFVYTPDPGYVGRDRYTWLVNDGTSTSEGLVLISVTPPWTGGASNLSQIGVNNVHFYAGQVGSDPSTAPELNQATTILADFGDLGIETMRQLSLADADWASIEPIDDYFFYEDPDALLAETGIEPRYTLFSPRYASPTPPWETDPALFQKALGPEAYDYLDHVLTRYTPTVRYWELGNEMYHWVAADPPATAAAIADLPASYPLDGYSPEEQAEFLAAAAAHIRSYDPDALIVLPSVIAGNAATDEWIARVVEHSGSDWFDVVSYHSYAEWTVARADRPHLDVQIAALGLDDKLVQLTETGSSSDPLNTTRTDYPNSETTQAADVFRRVLPGWAAGDSTALWHTYREHTDEVNTGIEGSALFEEDGAAKPSAWAMMLLTTELLPFVQVTDASSVPNSVYAYEVRSADGATHWVVWGSGTWTVPDGMTEQTSVMADTTGVYTWTPAVGGDSIALDDTPILLR